MVKGGKKKTELAGIWDKRKDTWTEKLTYSSKRLVQMQICFRKFFKKQFKKKIVIDQDRLLDVFLDFVRLKVRPKSNKQKLLFGSIQNQFC